MCFFIYFEILWKQALILCLSGWVAEWADVMTGSSGEQKLETHNISSRKSGSGSSVSLSRTTLAPFYLQSCGNWKLIDQVCKIWNIHKMAMWRQKVATFYLCSKSENENRQNWKFWLDPLYRKWKASSTDWVRSSIVSKLSIHSPIQLLDNNILPACPDAAF